MPTCSTGSGRRLSCRRSGTTRRSDAMHIDTPMSEPLRGNFVLLRADKLRLLLPQDHVGEASYLEEPPEPTELPGVFMRSGEAGEDLIVAMSSRMKPLQSFPPDRFFV